MGPSKDGVRAVFDGIQSQKIVLADEIMAHIVPIQESRIDFGEGSVGSALAAIPLADV